MQHTLIFTFIGIDKPGVIEQLATLVNQAQGNWLESRMLKLAGQFAGVVQVSLAEEKLAQLKDQLQALQSDNFAILLRAVDIDTIAIIDSAQYKSFSIIGLDRPGIVREISQLLANQNINVVDMHSLVESAPMSGGMLFKAQIKIALPKNLDVDALQDDLAQACNRLDLDWDLL